MAIGKTAWGGPFWG